MVQYQLVSRGIHDERVLKAMSEIPRHEFVPELYRHAAYEDCPLPIGEEQTISQPYMVAIMTQCLELKGEEKVLEIGTGSGYQAAVLSRLADHVYTIERHEALALKAKLFYKRRDVITWMSPRETEVLDCRTKRLFRELLLQPVRLTSQRV